MSIDREMYAKDGLKVKSCTKDQKGSVVDYIDHYSDHNRVYSEEV